MLTMGKWHKSAVAWMTITLSKMTGATKPSVVAPPCNAMVPELPVHGAFSKQQLGSASVWDWTLKSGCRYALWGVPEMASCLKEKWLVLVGASNSEMWTMQLANMLVPGALSTKRDNFTVDGASTQLIDLIIKDGKVIYRNVVVDKDVLKSRKGMHSFERDHVVLRDAFNNVSIPNYVEGAIRITNFLGEFFDHVQLSTDAIDNATKWAKVDMTMVISIGLWYMNSVNCWGQTDWCAVRPLYTPPQMNNEQLFAKFRFGMGCAMNVLQKYCSPGGRAGRLGCTVTSIEHCSFSTGKVWEETHNALVEGMSGYKSRHLRFLDVWTLMQDMPEGTIGEHQSPVGMLWSWQPLLGSICKASQHTAGSNLAVFKGSMCHAEEVERHCSKKQALAKGYQHGWECMMEDLCMLAPQTLEGAMQLHAVTEMHIMQALSARPVATIAGSLAGLLVLLSLVAAGLRRRRSPQALFASQEELVAVAKECSSDELERNGLA
mmetsp:Transcript_23394/g.44870  ORF Transcript_23394/g.44870 Transcript_23394/m.44870 type:complete len:490 (-) Transcript_23394:19-1488(-)